MIAKWQRSCALRLAPCALNAKGPGACAPGPEGKTAHYPKGQGISLTLDDPCTDAGDDDKSA